MKTEKKSLYAENSASGEPMEINRIPLEQNTVYLKIICDFRDRADNADFFYSLDGKSWKKIGAELHMEYTIPHFMGYRFGLFNYATQANAGYVDFDFFKLSVNSY